MKRVCIAVFMFAVLIGSVVLIETSVCKLTYNKNQKETEELLRMAYDYIDDNDYNDTTKENEKEEESNAVFGDNDEDIIGVLKIDKLQIEAPIRDGTSQEIMRTSIGHFYESDYWNGNVAFASHNGGTNAHFFEKIDTLEENDEIEYITKQGVKKYKVQYIRKIKDTDWSLVVKNNNQPENTITLITCINKMPDYRLCVRGVEV